MLFFLLLLLFFIIITVIIIVLFFAPSQLFQADTSVDSPGCVLPLQESITLLIMCAVSSTTLFCNSPGATSAPKFSRFLFRDMGIVPNVPMVIGTTSTGLSHSLLSSIRRSWYLSLLFLLFLSALDYQGTATSMSDTSLFVLSTRVKSGRCADTTLSVLIL